MPNRDSSKPLSSAAQVANTFDSIAGKVAPSDDSIGGLWRECTQAWNNGKTGTPLVQLFARELLARYGNHTVEIQLPARRNTPMRADEGTAHLDFDNGWNCCLEAVQKLNSQPDTSADGCTDPENCRRCQTMPEHRGNMQHAGIESYPPKPPASAKHFAERCKECGRSTQGLDGEPKWCCYCGAKLTGISGAAPIMQEPIDMILYCPACGTQHIDAPDGAWTNPPHRSHLCASCGYIWRPADVATNGVAAIVTKGTIDTSKYNHGTAHKAVR